MKMATEITAETSSFLYKTKVTSVLDKVLNTVACQGHATHNTMYGAGGKSSGVE
jgi:hypothetical protein